MWKLFDLIEQDKDGKKTKVVVCKICTDTTLAYAGTTSNLMHHLEVKHHSEYTKAKGEENDKSYKRKISFGYFTWRRR